MTYSVRALLKGPLANEQTRSNPKVGIENTVCGRNGSVDCRMRAKQPARYGEPSASGQRKSSNSVASR
jgi:hypothetical protein